MIICDIADSDSSCERPGGEFSNELAVELKKKLSAGFGLKVFVADERVSMMSGKISRWKRSRLIESFVFCEVFLRIINFYFIKVIR